MTRGGRICFFSSLRSSRLAACLSRRRWTRTRPLPHGFMADDDATRGQQLLHHAKPEREAEVEPDGMADDLGREAIPGVAGASGYGHPTRLLTPACRRKRGKARQLDGAVATT